MRHRSLLAGFRGKDGRSLARALVALVLASLFAGGLNAGAAAATPGAVLCVVDRSDDGNRTAPHLAVDCCVSGLAPLAMALAAVPPEAAAPARVAAEVASTVAAVVVHHGLPGAQSARGPPLSA